MKRLKRICFWMEVDAKQDDKLEAQQIREKQADLEKRVRRLEVIRNIRSRGS